ncbi:hypothetical protein LEP1GSC051_2234 [Leptospira sp. P2653]|nr:hypothetical protein LEP1GSC051_2234 [Leptospira sp. P2653]
MGLKDAEAIARYFFLVVSKCKGLPFSRDHIEAAEINGDGSERKEVLSKTILIKYPEF